jgi:hypothetical protein
MQYLKLDVTLTTIKKYGELIQYLHLDYKL